ncbi:hypothetical protein KHA80_14335 [Anaerobacillus sp. HL2]|nr:hypothetical protein KHA80_14335 [Anaerobacillus sp. HL2]
MFARTKINGSGIEFPMKRSLEICPKSITVVLDKDFFEDEKTYRIEQKYLIDHVNLEVYETLISAVLSGAIVIRDLGEEKEYLQHEWTPPGNKWIDPIKEANANKISLASNQTTHLQKSHLLSRSRLESWLTNVLESLNT